MSRERIVGLICDKTPRLPHGDNDDDGDCYDDDYGDDDDAMVFTMRMVMMLMIKDL